MAADNAVKRRSLLPGQRNGAASDRKRRIGGDRNMTTFALFYGNRAFMPDEVIDEARPQLEKAVKKQGLRLYQHGCRADQPRRCRNGARRKIYARFLEENKGEV